MLRKTGEFVAVDESANEHTIFEFTNFDPPGGNVYKLSNGYPVNLLLNGSYEVVKTGQLLHRKE